MGELVAQPWSLRTSLAVQSAEYLIVSKEQLQRTESVYSEVTSLGTNRVSHTLEEMSPLE